MRHLSDFKEQLKEENEIAQVLGLRRGMHSVCLGQYKEVNILLQKQSKSGSKSAEAGTFH